MKGIKNLSEQREFRKKTYPKVSEMERERERNTNTAAEEMCESTKKTNINASEQKTAVDRKRTRKAKIQKENKHHQSESAKKVKAQNENKCEQY